MYRVAPYYFSKFVTEVRTMERRWNSDDTCVVSSPSIASLVRHNDTAPSRDHLLDDKSVCVRQTILYLYWNHHSHELRLGWPRFCHLRYFRYARTSASHSDTNHSSADDFRWILSERSVRERFSCRLRGEDSIRDSLDLVRSG